MYRSTIYSQEQGRSFDFLWFEKDAMTALGALEVGILGANTTVLDGLVASPSSPASLVLNLTAGHIYQQAAMDSTAWGSLTSDATVIQQQGVAAAQTVTLSTTGLTSGQSRWALIQASFAQVDAIRPGDPTAGLLYYYNSANPAEPFQGQGGTGVVQDTVRESVCTITVVYGTVAATGSEVPPNPSSGNVPMYLVDLAFGQTTITSGQILVAGPSVGTNVPSNYPGAPFIAGLLNSHHSGAAGQAPKIKMTELAGVSSDNSGGGISTVYSYAGNPNGFVAGVQASGVLPPDFCVDTTHNILYFCSTTGNAAGAIWTPTTGQAVNFIGPISTGSANAQVSSPISPSGFALVNGYSVTFTPGFTNTSATTFAAGSTVATACRKNSGGSLVAFTGGEFAVNVPVTVLFNGTYWVLQTNTFGATAFLNLGQWTRNDGSGNLTLSVNSDALGDDGSGKLTIVPSAALPAGAIMMFAGSTPPSGWLQNNGQAVSRSAYANLFAAIGTTYGAGNGTTTFNVPNDTGYFWRSLNNTGAGIDSGRTLGSTQAANVASASGSGSISGTATGSISVTAPANALLYQGGGAAYTANGNDEYSNLFQSDFTSTGSASLGVTGSASVTVGSGTDNRPANIAYLSCIKY